MKRLEVGMRVRVVAEQSQIRGEIGTIWEIITNAPAIDWDGALVVYPVGYRVDIDGRGKRTPRGGYRIYEAHHIEPLDDDRFEPADDEAFIEWCSRLGRGVTV